MQLNENLILVKRHYTTSAIGYSRSRVVNDQTAEISRRISDL